MALDRIAARQSIADVLAQVEEELQRQREGRIVIQFNSLRAVDAKVRELKQVLREIGASDLLKEMEQDSDFGANSTRVRLEALANYCGTTIRLLDMGASLATTTAEEAIPGSQQTAAAGAEPDPRRVFVVHGRNKAARDALFTFLRAISLEPIEWSTAVQMTGQASPYIGTILDTAFREARAVVVLLTPDEIACLRPEFAAEDDDPETKPAPQARPNVLFEAGQAMGRDEKRTVLVEFGKVRPFTDVLGRHAVRLDGSSEKRMELARRLATAGCSVDLSGDYWLSAGDFTVPSPPVDTAVQKSERPAVAAADLDIKRIQRAWPAVMEMVKERKISAQAILNPATPVGYADGELVLEFGPKNRFHHDKVSEPGSGYLTPLVEALFETFGVRPAIRCVLRSE